uniref:Uncharacterized protein n=1 Tax=Arundo donax TaxID=35708 RepID=A0A0A9HJX1_ARUDO
MLWCPYTMPPCRFSVLAIYLAGKCLQTSSASARYKVALSAPLIHKPHRPWKMHGLSIYMVLESRSRMRMETKS